MSMDRETALQELENVRASLLDLVNNKVDALIARIQSGESLYDADTSNDEQGITYPLDFFAAHFKGKKPAAVHFGEEVFEVKKWREVYTLVLRRCDDDKHDALMALRNKMAGRERIFLSDKPDGMNRPTKINEELYAEAAFDAEYIIVILRQILDAVHFDYSGVSVMVVPGKRGK